MFSVSSKHVNWSDEVEMEYGNWDLSCPECEDTGMVIDPLATWQDATVTERLDVCNILGIDPSAAESESVPTEIIQLSPEDVEVHFDNPSETECSECDGSGAMEPIWNTVWEIGKQVSDDERRKVKGTGCVVVFDCEGGAWLTLGGCGQDMTPHLCHAWLEVGYTWLPLEWISSLLSNEKYLEACKNPEVSKRIRLAMDDTLNTAKLRIIDMIEINSHHVMIGVPV